MTGGWPWQAPAASPLFICNQCLSSQGLNAIALIVIVIVIVIVALALALYCSRGGLGCK